MDDERIQGRRKAGPGLDHGADSTPEPLRTGMAVTAPDHATAAVSAESVAGRVAGDVAAVTVVVTAAGQRDLHQAKSVAEAGPRGIQLRG